MFASPIQDVRYALRQLRKAPGFAATAVTVLALGLGANIAVFTLIEGIMLRPLPYARPSEVVAIDRPPVNGFNQSMSYANIRQLGDAAGSSVLTGALLDQTMASVVGPAGRFQIEKLDVTANMMDVLGVQPLLGRTFRADENNPGRNGVVLLSEEVWRKVYAGSAAIPGQDLIIKSKPYTIIGVMPRSFAFPFGESMQVWSPAPIGLEARTQMSGRKQMWGSMLARVSGGMTAMQLKASLDRAQSQIAKQVPEGEIPPSVVVRTYQQSLSEQARKPLGLLYAVVVGIWALACLNVMSLMLARAVSRTREQAVRSALGATRSRLLQQAVLESLVLSIFGSVLGLIAGQAAIKLLWHRIALSLPLSSAIHVEWRVVAALSLLTLLTALLVGVFPALRASRRNVQDGLRGANSTASASHNRIREVLVVAQLALTLVFLVGAGLFLRTIHALRQVPLGFSEQNVLTGGIILNAQAGGWDDQASAGNANIVQTSYLPLLERVQAIPGVRAAALSSVLPMRSEFAVMISADLDHKGAAQSHTAALTADGRLASAGLVNALGIPMVSGRFFSEEDSATSPVVVVVNQAFVNKYLRDQNPLGHVISMGKGRFDSAQIVGVIGDVKQGDLRQDTKPEIYFCLAQMAPGAPLYNIATAFIEVAIRGSVKADALRAQFDKALHEVAPDATTTDVKTIHEAVEDSFGSESLTAYLLEGFAGLALLIASVGLYGLLSFAVAQRTSEIGLRLALGAQRSNILKLVLSRAVLLVGCGLLCGSLLAWFSVFAARSYLFRVQTHDVITFAVVPVVLAAASLLAAFVPARRAASIDPMKALRAE